MPNKTVRWTALTCLTLVNLLNYIDRYIFSALLPAIKADLKFTDTELGVLGSSFLFAYVIASPVFGWLGDRGARSRLMSSGVAIWSVATAFSGIATTFMGQLLTRAAVGLGESAYTVIAPTAISDHFSKVSRGKVFAVYSGAIPVGSALGYVIGGWLEPRIGWHKSFFVVGIPGLVLAVILFFLPDPKRGATEEIAFVPDKAKLNEVYLKLMKNGGFVTTVMGYAAYTFVVGGMAFWMPSYLVRYFDVSLEKANISFGALTVVGGFLGTLIGGVWADRIERRTGNGYLKICVLSMVFSVPLLIYGLTFKEYNHFMAALFFVEVALFMCISPLDAAVVSYVRPAWRGSAMALCVVLIHVLGDGISRTLMGVVSDQSGLQAAIALLPWALVVAGLFWLAGVIFFWQAAHWPEGALKLPQFQAHRGFRPSASVVENTLAAFREARTAGAEMTECDVHLSKDGQAVVFHDFDLQRLGGGRKDRIEALTASELKSAVGAPTLLELLNDESSPRLVNIELKTKDKLRGRGLEVAVLRAIREAKAESRVMFSSFNPFSLHRLANLAPEIPRALLASEENDPLNKIYLKRLWLGLWARPHALNLDHVMITPDRIESWRDRGLTITGWTVNEPERARALLKMGAAGVISDAVFSKTRAGL